MTRPAPPTLKPCPLCDDPMEIRFGRFAHKSREGNCLFIDLAWPAEAGFPERWNRRPDTPRD